MNCILVFTNAKRRLSAHSSSDLFRSPLSIAAPNAFHRSASASYQFTVTGRISDRRSGDLWCTTSWTVVAIGSKRFPCAFSHTHLPNSGFCRRLLNTLPNYLRSCLKLSFHQTWNLAIIVVVFVKTHFCTLMFGSIPDEPPNCGNR